MFASMTVHDVNSEASAAATAVELANMKSSCGLTSLQSNWSLHNTNSDWSIIQGQQADTLHATGNGLLSDVKPYSQLAANFYGFYPQSYPHASYYQDKCSSNNEINLSALNGVAKSLMPLTTTNKTNLNPTTATTSQSLQYNYNSQATIQVPSSSSTNTTNYQTFTTQKMSNATTKLSYTPYQLELLNSIYKDMKYPNSVQKTLVAKRIGITRDQVKIWFQNRRRKDTINAQLKYQDQQKVSGKRKSDEIENEDPCSPPEIPPQQMSIVDSQIVQSVLNELRSHKHAPSRLSSKRTRIASSDSDEIKPTSDSHGRKKTSVSDLCPSSSSQTTSPVNEQPQQASIMCQPALANQCPTAPCSNDYYSSASNSLSTLSSSSEESESGLSYTVNNQAKLSVMQQPCTIQDYVHRRYYQHCYYTHEQQTWSPATKPHAYDTTSTVYGSTSHTTAYQYPYGLHHTQSKSTYSSPDDNSVASSFSGNLYPYQS